MWAHNGHITKRRHGGAVSPLGQHLHARYGDAYDALGPLFGKGAFRAARRVWPGPWPRAGARAVVSNPIGSARPAAVEAQLATANPGDHLVDLRAAADASATVQQWRNGPHLMRGFGALGRAGQGVRRTGLRRSLDLLPTPLCRIPVAVSAQSTGTPGQQ